MPDDISDGIGTTGRVTVGSSLTGEIETTNDSDAYAVELVAGRTYRIDLEGAATGKGTLADPFLRWLRDSSGNGFHGTRDYDGGEGLNPRQVFTPQLSGTYYITASGQGDSVGTYTLRVTDTSAPVFGASAYGFELAENTDGGAARVSLGTVSATDPEGASVGYSIVGGNESGSFEIDAASGELFYIGTGEDYESGTTSYELTVRASDGTGFADATVTIGVTDVPEQAIVAPPDPETLQTVSEPDGEDFSRNISTAGRVVVGDTATGNIGTRGDRDWFAVELVADREYRIDLRGGPTGDGTLSDPYLRGIYDAEGALISGTTNDDGGVDTNSRVTFTARETGAYYIAAGAFSGRLGTYELEVRDISPQTEQQETENGPQAGQTPVFSQPSYAFDLAENADGALFGIAVAPVVATDPDNDRITYSIEAGDPDGLFMIDARTGLVVYLGAGEDYESGTRSYELTVRASDGGLHSDVTVNVNVTDVAEAPAFGQQGYAFDLTENADGGTDRVSLGTVTATDPDNDTVAYSIEGGNASGLFEIDAASGELFYVGAGEDYESGTTSYDLMVRASDGQLTADASVSVAVTDVLEQTIVAPADPEILQSVSEPDGEDLPTNTSTIGRVAVGGAATGTIGRSGDRDGFAVELVEGQTYIIDLRGSPTEDGTLRDPYLRGIKGPDGRRIADVSNDDGGEGYNSRLSFTPTESGTHYIIAGAYSGRGTYELEVRDISPQSAQQETVNGPPVFDYRFVVISIVENADGSTTGVSLGTVTATDPEGDTVVYSIEGGNASSLFEIDSQTGELFYVGTGEDYESGTTSYELTVRASDGSLHSDMTVTVNVADVEENAVLEEGADEAPVFISTGYAFSLAENADGGTDRVSLGTVTATDPDNDTVVYSIEGGNASGLFEIDAASGELFYVGAGEDYEAGAAQFDLTVRASDGTNSTNTTVTVNVTDVHESIVSEPEGWDFPENTHTPGRVVVGGSVSGRLESTVTSLDSDWFAVELTAGRTYVLDFEKGPGLYHTRLDFHDAHGVAVERGRWGSYTPSESGTYYVAVRSASYSSSGTYTLGVIDDTDEDASRGSANDLGDITILDDVRLATATVGEYVDEVDYYQFMLSAPKAVTLELLEQDADANLILEDEDGNILHSSHGAGTADETISATLLAGTYFVRINAQQSRNANDYVLRYGVSDADADEVARLEEAVGGPPASVPEPEGSDFPDNVDTPGRLLVGESVTGRVDFLAAYRHDVDWFAITVEAGRIYRLDLEGSDTERRTLRNPELHMYDSEGRRFDWSRSGNDEGAGLNSRVYFAPSEPGTYYVAAKGGLGTYPERTSTGTYTLTLADVTERLDDDHPHDASTTGRVNAGGSVTGESEEAGDIDWFAVTLVGGVSYRIDLKGSHSGQGTLSDPFLRGVYDSEGNIIAGTANDDHYSHNPDSRVAFTPSDSGEYFLAASTRGDQTGTYRLSVGPVADDYAADIDTNGTVAVGGSATGEIDHGGDVDWFALELAAEQTYRIDVLAVGFYNPRIEGIYDTDGNLLADSANEDHGYSSANATSFVTPSESGTYYVGAGTSLDGLGTYTVRVEAVDDPYSADTGTTGMVSVNGAVSSAIDLPGDVDWFAVTLDQGRTYRFEVRGPVAELTQLGYQLGIEVDRDVLVDPFLTLYDGDGTLIRNSDYRVYNDTDGFFFEHAFSFTATESGTYFAGVSTPNTQSPHSTGMYRLTVTDGADDYANDTNTTGVIMVGGTASGVIGSRDDADWFVVTLEAGKSYQIRQMGWDSDGGTLTDPSFNGIYDSSGSLIAGTSNDDSSFNERGEYVPNNLRDSMVTFTADTDGVYYLSAGGSSYLNFGQVPHHGTYTMSIEEVL